MPLADKQLVDLMADKYEGKFVHLPRMIYETIVGSYAAGQETWLADNPEGAVRARELDRCGRIGGRPVLVAYLKEIRAQPSQHVLISQFKLLKDMPFLNGGEETTPPQVIRIAVYEQRSSVGNCEFTRELKVQLGDSIDGLQIMKYNFDYIPIINEVIDLAYRTGRQFETMRLREKHALQS
jgi:hypothetical protein